MVNLRYGRPVPNDWAQRVGEDLQPTTWDECVGILRVSGGHETMYRGHRCFDWRLWSTLERALYAYAQQWDHEKYQVMESMVADYRVEQWTSDVEGKLTQYFLRNAMRFDIPRLPEAWDTVGWWEIMQLHGAPTRLIDWTLSPFIALWFALDGHESGSGDMALWIYDRRTGTVNHAGAQSKLESMEGYERLDDRQLVNQFIRFAIDDGGPALIPVRPRQFSRTVAQQSLLTVSPNISTGRSAHWWIRKKLATRIRLREEWKQDMVSACRSMGLTRPGLFRDLDSLGSYIAQSFIGNTEMTDGIS